MGVRVRWARPAPAAAVALVLAAGALAGVPPSAAAQPDGLRYFQAAVNLPPGAPGADGFAGSVSLRRVLGDATSVSVFLSRSTAVACPDGEGTASVTVRTVTDEATGPGPVVLDVDRQLREAHGEAVVDLVVEEDPGCGAPSTSTTLPGETVSVRTTGTSDRFHAGVSSTVTSTAGSVRSSSDDLSRDGVGTATVGSLVTGGEGAAFLKYAVERTHVHGTPPQAPANTAPPGGYGATGASSESLEPPDGLGVVFRDVGVTASSTPHPSSTTISAFAEVHTVVGCPGGGTALSTELLEGAGTGTLTVAGGLDGAVASGTLSLTRTTVDGCAPDAPPAVAVVPVPVSLDLTATGPPVRVRDVRFFETRGPGDRRTDTSYLARDAAGTLTVGDVSVPTGLASVSRARR